MGLLDALSGGLTAATQAAEGQEQGKMQGSQMLRAIMMQEAQRQKEQASTDALLDPVARQDRHDVARSTVAKNEKAATAEPAPRIIPTSGGFVQIGRDGKPTPLLGSNGRPLMPHEAPQAQPGNVFVTGVGADGKPTIFAGKNKGNPSLVDTGVSKPSASGTGGQNAPQMAAAKANLESARQLMNEYEEKLKRGEAKIGITGATEGALASSPTALTAKTPWDAIMSLGANAAASHLQSSDPEFARYMTAKKYVAEAILNTHKRPNQTQYEIEQELSGAGPGATPQQIAMGRERRDRMYDEVFANPAAGAVTSSHAPASSGNVDLGHASHAQQLWDAAVAKHGQAAVVAKFGPRPAQ